MNTTIRILEEARALADERARELGFESIDTYVDALIRHDQSDRSFQEWMRAEIEAGFASGVSEESTPARVSELVGRGIERARGNDHSHHYGARRRQRYLKASPPTWRDSTQQSLSCSHRTPGHA